MAAILQDPVRPSHPGRIGAILVDFCHVQFWLYKGTMYSFSRLHQREKDVQLSSCLHIREYLATSSAPEAAHLEGHIRMPSSTPSCVSAVTKLNSGYVSKGSCRRQHHRQSSGVGRDSEASRGEAASGHGCTRKFAAV